MLQLLFELNSLSGHWEIQIEQTELLKLGSKQIQQGLDFLQVLGLQTE